MNKLSISQLSVSVADIKQAYKNVKNIVSHTPLQFCERLSEKYHSKVFLKREDLQKVRSYKIRGAYNFICQLNAKDRKKGVVCASAGNHAQGVALACKLLKIKGIIFMPKPTPKQKIERVKAFGNHFVQIIISGDTFDEANAQAKEHAGKNGSVFVHPFDDPKVIAGQGTVAIEILKQAKQKIDYLILPIGGGGLASGTGVWFKTYSPKTKIIGVEPEGAACMKEAFLHKKSTALKHVDKFVDGAAVKLAGENTFQICSKVLDKLVTVSENHICTNMIELYQSEGVLAEPAGALSVSALDILNKSIKNKTVVCVISGGNNDISRYSEVLERSLIDRGIKHYFIVEFPQRPGALRSFLDEALGPNDDITLFEYVKKNNRESGPALIGIELGKKEDLNPLMEKMKKLGMSFEHLKTDSPQFKFLI